MKMPQSTTKKSVFDYINSVSDNKRYIWDEDSESEYVPFLANRFMSLFIDTVLIANAININTPLDKKANYDYYFNIVRGRKRFSKWPKTIPDNELKAISKYFNINKEKAKKASKLLTPEQKKIIFEYFDD